MYPATESRWRTLGAGGTAILFGAISTLLNPQPAMYLAFAVLGAPACLWLVLYAYRTRVVLTSTSFGKVPAFGKPRMHPRGAVAEIVVAEFVNYTRGEHPVQYVFVRDADNRLLLDVHDTQFAAEDLNVVIAELDAPVTTYDNMLMADFDQRYPGLVPWHLRHPGLFGSAIVVAVVAVVAAIAISTT